MDQPVRWVRRLAGLTACWVALASSALGADLPDPTRPPPALTAPAGEAAPAAPVLQSVLLSPTRRAAIISGQTVVLGGTYQGARLIRITESEAVLRDGGKVQTLKLYPDLHKQMVSHAGAGAAAKPYRRP